MKFNLNYGTEVLYNGDNKPVLNAIKILNRDIKKKFNSENSTKSFIELKEDASLEAEAYVVEVSEKIIISASEELGFVYGLLSISEKYLGIKPFWFWMDQEIKKEDAIEIEYTTYKNEKPIVKYRGWFVNDEVLIMKWDIDGDKTEPWRMVFEALLRCGGNIVIPGTDKNSRIYNKLASDMGLWITHHHAEPLGAEMFIRKYPGMEPNYAETPELFEKLWEEAVEEQKDYKVVWTVGFRGQGDCPFWSHDTSGRFDTPAKRGKLISDVMKLQMDIVKKYVKNPVFCTNLYGEVMELYDEGHIDLPDDIIHVSADNGYGKMVTRRRENHTARVVSLPKERIEHGGIYYHVSFYDLQAANHITMLPNSVEFVNRELDEVIEKNVTDFWVINSSNIRPHTYYLDALRKKWFGMDINDDEHSIDFVNTYYGNNEDISKAYRDYHKAVPAYGKEEDEHAGEQFYTESVRIFAHAAFVGNFDGAKSIRWLVGENPLDVQVKLYTDICRNNFENVKAFYEACLKTSESLTGKTKQLFDSTILLQTAIHYLCTKGAIEFEKGYKALRNGEYKDAFIMLGDCAKTFYNTNSMMRNCEYGVWKGFYFNDCFADIKHTAYMVERLMGYAREFGDNPRHDKWYREAAYAPCDRGVMTLLVTDNHMTDWELYKAFKENKWD